VGRNEVDEAKREQVKQVLVDHSRDRLRNVGDNWRILSRGVAYLNVVKGTFLEAGFGGGAIKRDQKGKSGGNRCLKAFKDNY